MVAYVAACCGALFVLKFFNPVQWLRLFSTDYSIGFIFVAGGLLAIFAKKVRPQNLLLALAAAAYVIALTYQQVGYVCPTRLEQGLNPPRARKFSEKSLVHQNDFRYDRNDFPAVEIDPL